MMRKNGFLCYAYCGGQSASGKYAEELQLHLNVIELPHEHVLSYLGNRYSPLTGDFNAITSCNVFTLIEHRKGRGER